MTLWVLASCSWSREENVPPSYIYFQFIFNFYPNRTALTVQTIMTSWTEFSAVSKAQTGSYGGTYESLSSNFYLAIDPRQYVQPHILVFTDKYWTQIQLYKIIAYVQKKMIPSTTKAAAYMSFLMSVVTKFISTQKPKLFRLRLLVA